MTALIESCSRATDGASLLEDVAERLHHIVPFDGSVLFATDPGTIMMSAPAWVENVVLDDCEAYWWREYQVPDALLFRDIVRSEAGAGTLLGATDAKPSRSARYREFIAPQGYGDELRAACRVAGSTWGMLDLFRDRSRRPFTTREVELVRTVAPAVALALRGSAQHGRISAQRSTIDGPGTALFDAGTLISLDEQAERLFTEIAGPHWATVPPPMSAVYGVVARTQAIQAGTDRGPATARLRATSGRWLTIHGSSLRPIAGGPGPIAITVEPARSTQIAPIIVEAYSLTAREQEITRAVARGLSNPEIAATLTLSPHTVRDHLKAIFTKVGVNSRGELVAKLFAEHYLPALHDPNADVVYVYR